MSGCFPVALLRFPQYDNPKGAAFKSDTSDWHPPRILGGVTITLNAQTNLDNIMNTCKGTWGAAALTPQGAPEQTASTFECIYFANGVSIQRVTLNSANRNGEYYERMLWAGEWKAWIKMK